MRAENTKLYIIQFSQTLFLFYSKLMKCLIALILFMSQEVQGALPCKEEFYLIEVPGTIQYSINQNKSRSDFLWYSRVDEHNFDRLIEIKSKNGRKSYMSNKRVPGKII